MYSYIKLASTAINIILRICLKNQKDYVIDNAVDLANLSVGLGLYQLDALDMQANINKSIILITREMSESKISGSYKKIYVRELVYYRLMVEGIHMP
ncbi:hypothetical protein [Pseudobutyrivibrio sp.]|uniref:hypothetical protein n=1 Tax=Pseudobutyrivibrio sp. TaxID=2014367 RepID=UPI001B4C688E|nr:hypothetical protein [Pseudobutyrivibrio sp.]MBP3262789.1 hypothetical protein [Pseudobutyrivibrio sp.]